MIITYIDSELKKALLNLIAFWVRSNAPRFPLVFGCYFFDSRNPLFLRGIAQKTEEEGLGTLENISCLNTEKCASAEKVFEYEFFFGNR